MILNNLTNKERVVEFVKHIPDQKVVYFGQIGQVLQLNPRVVGWILSGLSPEECEGLPWYRVVAKDGYISSLKMGYKGILQKQILESQGYEIDQDNKVNMQRYLLTDLRIIIEVLT